MKLTQSVKYASADDQKYVLSYADSLHRRHKLVFDVKTHTLIYVSIRTLS
jgi:hypothetical protein